MTHLKSNALLYERQRGFRAGLSMVTELQSINQFNQSISIFPRNTSGGVHGLKADLTA